MAFSILDALDIFAAHLCERPERQKFIQKICEAHSANHETLKTIGPVDQLSNDPSQFFLDFYKPEIGNDSGVFSAGRGKMALIGQLDQKYIKKTDMVPTLIHSRLMEQITVAVSQSEPVLLVGETGTGKTSCVQFCAARCGRRLRVVNMSRQSQASDLIGAFRPVDQTSIIRPIFRRFHFLMVETYSSENEKFLTLMARAMAQKSFEDVLIPGIRHIIKQVFSLGKGFSAVLRTRCFISFFTLRKVLHRYPSRRTSV